MMASRFDLRTVPTSGFGKRRRTKSRGNPKSVWKLRAGEPAQFPEAVNQNCRASATIIVRVLSDAKSSS